MARLIPPGMWLPTLTAALLTAVIATFSFYCLTLLFSSFLSLAGLQPLELAGALLALALLGLTSGIVAVWPVMLIMGAIGARLAETRFWARTSGAWLIVGAMTGCAIFGSAILVGGESMDVFPILLFGSSCGALGGFICHLLMRIGRD